jgi:hypothetical protein
VAYEYGQKVVYVEGETGNEYDAEIVGPILKITGRKGGKNVVPGKAQIGTKFVRKGQNGKEYIEEHPGMGLSEVQTPRGDIAQRECYTLRVNFGDDKFGDISGVSPEGKNMNTYKKSYFKAVQPAPSKLTETKPADKK